MPTYDYKCVNGHLFESFQSINTEPVADCPNCGEKAKRMIGAGAGLMFKGSGFYITDYKNGNGSKTKKGTKQESEAESKTELKTEPKTETETKKE